MRRQGGRYDSFPLSSIVSFLVQTALLQMVEPLAKKGFLDTSYGYRRGKGPHKALQRVEHILNKEKRVWVAEHDIDNFFQLVP